MTGFNNSEKHGAHFVFIHIYKAISRPWALSSSSLSLLSIQTHFFGTYCISKPTRTSRIRMQWSPIWIPSIDWNVGMIWGVRRKRCLNQLRGTYKSGYIPNKIQMLSKLCSFSVQNVLRVARGLSCSGLLHGLSRRPTDLELTVAQLIIIGIQHPLGHYTLYVSRTCLHLHNGSQRARQRTHSNTLFAVEIFCLTFCRHCVWWWTPHAKQRKCKFLRPQHTPNALYNYVKQKFIWTLIDFHLPSRFICIFTPLTADPGSPNTIFTKLFLLIWSSGQNIF